MDKGLIIPIEKYTTEQFAVLRSSELIVILQTFYKRIQKCSTLESEQQKFMRILISIITSRNSTKHCNRLILELAYKIYYKILDLSGDEDKNFYSNMRSMNSTEKLLILHGILDSNYFKRQYVDLNEICLDTFHKVIKNDSKILLIALKNFNSLYKKFEENDLDFPLEHLYHCSQSNITGIRDEIMQLITNYTKNFQIACEYMNVVLHFWPWTNRIKFYFLSAILFNYKFSHFTECVPEFDENLFFEGLRSSLSCRSFFSAGQILVKTLENQQNSNDLKSLICKIIQKGTLDELINLNTQWMRYIKKKEEMFIELNLNWPWSKIQQNMELMNGKNNYKFPVICNMFVQQVGKHEDFKEIVKYLIENCFNYPLEIQLHIYFFILSSINVLLTNQSDNCLNFILLFIQTHSEVSNSEYRQAILSKIPQLFDLLSKKHAKMVNNQSVIISFFNKIMTIIHNGLIRTRYQSLIFSLRLLEIVIKSLFAQIKLTKNSNIKLNRTLAEILIKENVYEVDALKNELFQILKSSETRYEDCQEHIVSILQQMSVNNFDEAFSMCKMSNSSNSIDNCYLSSHYAKICLNSSDFCSDPKEFHVQFFEYCKTNILRIQSKIQQDPLETCKSGNHLFGYLNSLNELLIYNFSSINIEDLFEIINLLESIVNLILKMLNGASNDVENYAPSFQVMDKSLEMLVYRSSVEVTDHSDEKKFLLLSFWITLKACCDLATTIGSNLSVNTKDDDSTGIILIERCLMVNVTILSKCRHKGAIEAAGLSLGKLVKIITSHNEDNSMIYQILYSCFTVLFGNVNVTSTTRRGAGLPIMFHHLLKNEANKDHPLFNHAIKILLNHEQNTQCDNDEQHESFNALVLHYLCVIVKDTELREIISEYFDDIMMATIQKIEDNDWRVRNAALQLFGALVPKIIGQKQIVYSNMWQSIEFTYSDAFIKLPKTCEHILQYYSNLNGRNQSISSLILFLEFFSNVEFIRNYVNYKENLYFEQIQKFRQIFWKFLSHEYEKVRQLAARCTARIHDFHFELPHIIERAIMLLFKTNNENFTHGILLCAIECICKRNHDFQFITNIEKSDFDEQIKIWFNENYRFRNFSFYVRAELVKFFQLVKFDFRNRQILEILFSKENIEVNDICEFLEENCDNCLNPGYDIWKENVVGIYKI